MGRWIFALSIVLVSCSVVKKKSDKGIKPVKVVEKGQTQFKNAEQQYSQGYYEKSIKTLEAIETKHSSTSLEPEVQFLKAKAYLKMNELDAAEKFFKSSYHLWSKSHIGRGKALYFLSSVYERQSQDDKMIASLLELQSLKPSMDARVYKLDIPAKLSSAYAREGNIDEAEKYSKIVELYLKLHTPNSKLPKESLEMVAKSLYEVAWNSLADNSSRDFEEKVASIRYSQFYLLRAVELGISPWAEKALYDFEKVYRQLLDEVVVDWEALYYRNNKVSARRDQQRKLRQLERINSLLVDFESKMLPKGVINSKVYQRMSLAKDSYKKEIEIYYLEPEVGQGLTDAAKKLMGMDEKYRGLKPEQVLKRYHKQIELPIKDPNL